MLVDGPMPAVPAFKPANAVPIAAALLLVSVLCAAGARADMAGHGGMVRALDVSPDGTQVLSGSFDYLAILWDFSEQSELAVLDAHTAPVNDVAFIGDGSQAVTASDDGTAIIWSLEGESAGSVGHRLTGHGHKVMAVAVAPDGATVATGGWDETVRLWDPATGEQRRVIEAGSPVNAVAFLEDGDIVASGGHDGRIRLWNAATGAPAGELEGHGMAITRLRVVPRQRQVLSAGIDGTVRLWDIGNRSIVRTYRHHEHQVYGLALMLDGATALSTGREGGLVHWRLDDGETVRGIDAHEGPAWAVVSTRDGRFALTAGSDGTIRVWHLETGDRIGPVPQTQLADETWTTLDHPGARLFGRCAGCHTLSADGTRRSGPHFANLFGRPAGSVPGYNYSSALEHADFSWNAETLTALFEKGPDVFLPGTKMPLQRMTNEKDLENLVDFLRIVTNKDAGAAADETKGGRTQ